MSQGDPNKRMTIARSLIPIILFALTLSLGPGCSPKGEESLTITIREEGTEAAPSPESEAAPKAVSVLCPEGIVPPDLITGFTSESGVTVVMNDPSDHPDTIGSMGTFDLVLVDMGMLAQIIELGLAAPIPSGDIPNRAAISPPFSTPPVDPDGTYSVPFLWGTFGIVVNRMFITDTDIEWGILFDPHFAGRIDMPDDVRFVAEVAARELGTWLDRADPRTLDHVADLVFEQKKIVRGYFLIPEIIDHLAEGSSYLSFLDDRSALAAAGRNSSIQYVVPPSGAPLWLLFWVIPKESKHEAEAQRFIDFLLEPSHIAAVSNAYRFANVVDASRSHLSEEMTRDTAVILPEGVLVNSRLLAPPNLETENFLMRLKDNLM